MASPPTHACTACALMLPMEDGHDKCIRCLGFRHAEAARDNPASCMDCFIMPLRTREARFHFFMGKRPHSPSSDIDAKRRRIEPPDRAEAFSSQGTPTMEEPFHAMHRGEDTDVDVVSLFPSDEESVLTAGQGSPVAETTPGASELPAVPQLQEVLGRAATALDLTLPEDTHPPPSRFEENVSQPASARVPLLPDFETLILAQFGTPAAPRRWSSVSRRLANVSGAGRIGCDRPPPLDQSLAGLVSPASSALGRASCPSRNCRTMDSLLLRVHSAFAVQTKLANTAAILTLYLRHLSRGSEVAMEEVQLVASLLATIMKEQAVAAGRAMAAFWVARRHLWLSQSRLQVADRNSLIGLPIEPSAMFGDNALRLLQDAQAARRYANELSTPPTYRQRGRRPRAQLPQAPPTQPGWGPGDLRHQLEYHRGQVAQRQGRRRGASRRRMPHQPPARP